MITSQRIQSTKEFPYDHCNMFKSCTCDTFMTENNYLLQVFMTLYKYRSLCINVKKFMYNCQWNIQSYMIV